EACRVEQRLERRAQERWQRSRVRFRCRRERRRHCDAAPAPRRSGHRVHRPRHAAELARGHFRATRERTAMNYYAILAIFRFEMARFRRTLWQSLVTPVITTSLYFVVFGAAIGPRMREVDG